MMPRQIPPSPISPEKEGIGVRESNPTVVVEVKEEQRNHGEGFDCHLGPSATTPHNMESPIKNVAAVFQKLLLFVSYSRNLSTALSPYPTLLLYLYVVQRSTLEIAASITPAGAANILSRFGAYFFLAVIAVALTERGSVKRDAGRGVFRDEEYVAFDWSVVDWGLLPRHHRVLLYLTWWGSRTCHPLPRETEGGGRSREKGEKGHLRQAGSGEVDELPKKAASKSDLMQTCIQILPDWLISSTPCPSSSFSSCFSRYSLCFYM